MIKDARISILFLHEAEQVSGAENSLMNLVSRIDRTKFNPIFACPGGAPFSDKIKKTGVEVYPVAYSRIRGLVGVLPTIKKLRGIIKKNDIRLVHSNSIRTHIYGAMAARCFGIPIVWHQRNLLTDERIDPDRLFSFLPDRIVCNSRAVANRFLRNGSLPAKVRVVHNGVDTKIFNLSVNPQKVRGEFGIGSDKTVIGITSRFNIYKGHEAFFRAAKLLLDNAANAADRLCFLVVGGPVFDKDSSRERHLMDFTEKLKIRDKVIFTGFREDMPEIYAAIDICVLASEAEACGRVLIEAMASGKALVATDSGGTPELVKDNETGFLVKLADPQALADKIAVLVGDKDLAGKMGRAGRRLVEENFSIEKNVAEIQKIYLEVLEGR